MTTGDDGGIARDASSGFTLPVPIAVITRVPTL